MNALPFLCLTITILALAIALDSALKRTRRAEGLTLRLWRVDQAAKMLLDVHAGKYRKTSRAVEALHQAIVDLAAARKEVRRE